MLTSVPTVEPLTAATARYIRWALEECGNNKALACRSLRISYNTLQRYLSVNVTVDASKDPRDGQ